MTTFSDYIYRLKKRSAVHKLRRKWKGCLHHERFDEAISVAEQIINFDDNSALGWHLKAVTLIRKCPERKPDPSCEDLVVISYSEAFKRDRTDYGIASGFLAFLNWIGDRNQMEMVVSNFKGKKKADLMRNLEFFIKHSKSTRVIHTNRNQATGAIEDEAPTSPSTVRRSAARDG